LEYEASLATSPWQCCGGVGSDDGGGAGLFFVGEGEEG